MWPFSTVLSRAINALARSDGTDASREGLRTTLNTSGSISTPTPSRRATTPTPSRTAAATSSTTTTSARHRLGLRLPHLGDGRPARPGAPDLEFVISGWTDDDRGGGIYWQQATSNRRTLLKRPRRRARAPAASGNRGEAVPRLGRSASSPGSTCSTTRPPVSTTTTSRRTGRSSQRSGRTTPAPRSTPSPCSLAETGDDAWLARARSWPVTASPTSRPTANRRRAPIFPDTPWFNSILHRGYVALYSRSRRRSNIRPRPARPCSCTPGNTPRDADGFLPPDWSLTASNTDYRHLLEPGAVMRSRRPPSPDPVTVTIPSKE